MKEEQKLQIRFERYNSKYNRIWEQVVNMGLFILATTVAYVIAVGSIQKDVKTLLNIENVNYSLMVIAIIIGVCMSILITHLSFSRKELKKMLQENKIDF